MTVRPNYTIAAPAAMVHVKAGSNKAVDGKTHHLQLVCVSFQVTWKDLFTSLKMNHKVIRAPLSIPPSRCLSFIHYATVRWGGVG